MQTAAPLTESIKNLLKPLSECPDGPLLVPVIEELLQEHQQQQNQQSLQQLEMLATLARQIIEQGLQSENSKRILELVCQLADSETNQAAIQSLIKQLRLEPAHTAQPVESTRTESPVKARIAETETTAEADSTAQSIAPAAFDFHSLAGVENRTKSIEDATDKNTDSNEIKRLKETLQQRLDSTKEQCKEFEGLMHILLSDLREAQDSDEMETIRSMLNRSIKRLLVDHENISGNIKHVANELHRFENHCEQLNMELGRVKKLSLTDELTNLPNRRAFISRLKNESGRVQRYGYSLSVALLDLDLFKEINDTYGHAVGDEVLRAYTSEVLSSFRNYDLVARYGGEEFAVLLPHTDISGAERALNKVLERAAEASFKSKEMDKEMKIPTFSAGVSIYHEGEPIEDVINRADKAMYTAKKLGRNRVVVQTEN